MTRSLKTITFAAAAAVCLAAGSVSAARPANVARTTWTLQVNRETSVLTIDTQGGPGAPGALNCRTIEASSTASQRSAALLPVHRADSLRPPEPRLRHRGPGVHRQRLRRRGGRGVVHGRNGHRPHLGLRRPWGVQLLRDRGLRCRTMRGAPRRLMSRWGPAYRRRAGRGETARISTRSGAAGS